MLYPPNPPQKHSVVGKAYFLSNFFSLRDHALLHKGLFFERPIKDLYKSFAKTKQIIILWS